MLEDYIAQVWDTVFLSKLNIEPGEADFYQILTSKLCQQLNTEIAERPRVDFTQMPDWK